MSTDSKIYVDGVLVEYGARLFWPKNKLTKGTGGSGAFGVAVAAWRPTPQQVRTQINAVIKRTPQVMVKITGGGRGMGRIAGHFTYISRNGGLTLENEKGELKEGHAGLNEVKDDWREGGSYIETKSHRREAFNIMLSMPADTDAAIVKDAAREFAAREFSNHQYVFVLHTPENDLKTERPHVHLSVRAEGFDGHRLNPRKADLQRWRELFAETLQARGIEATATRRVVEGKVLRPSRTWHKHAHERGVAPNKPVSPVSDREIEQHREAITNWGAMAKALIKSDDPQDQAMAASIVKVVVQDSPAHSLLKDRLGGSVTAPAAPRPSSRGKGEASPSRPENDR